MRSSSIILTQSKTLLTLFADITANRMRVVAQYPKRCSLLAVMARSCVGSQRELLLGQFISVLITFTGIFSQLLSRDYEVRFGRLGRCWGFKASADAGDATGGADPGASDPERGLLPAAVRVPGALDLAVAGARHLLARGEWRSSAAWPLATDLETRDSSRCGST